MQTDPFYIGYFVIALICATIVWFMIWDFEKKGKQLKYEKSKGEISEFSGRGAWYAKNINRDLKAMIYTVVHFLLILP